MNSINYYKKYIKYKNKYLEIKSQNGGIPLRDIIFQISEIEDPEMNLYLNPLFGFVYYSNGFIFNYKYFYPETSIGKILNEKEERFFHQVGNVIKPSEHLLPKLSCKEIGIIAGLLYLICIKNINECTRELLLEYPLYKPAGESKKSKDRSKILTKLFYDSFEEAKTKVEEAKTKVEEAKVEEAKEILQDLFRLLLVILWWKIENPKNISEYFEGLKQSITSLTLKADTEETVEFKNLFIQTLSPIELIEMAKVKHFCYDVSLISGLRITDETYPNCGENVLNNLFNILAHYYKKDFMSKLINLKANPKLINFYKTFTEETITKEIDFYGKKSNFMDAWSHVVSNLDGVKYNRKGIRDDKEYNFEIRSGLNKAKNNLNLLQVISQLIPDVNSWEDFFSKFNELKVVIKKIIDSNGLGNININIKNFSFIIYLKDGHYEIKEDTSVKSTITFTHTPQMLSKVLIGINLKKVNFITLFRYIKWKNKDLIDFINKNQLITKVLYTKIVNFLIDYATDDEFEQILVSNFNKITNLDDILKKIKSIKIDLPSDLQYLFKTEKLIKLEIINDNLELCNSLSALTSLKILNLNFYELPLHDSLLLLTSLHELNLHEYCHSFGNSLSTLTNLKILNLHSMGKQTPPLENSLFMLTSLEYLDLDSYTHPLQDSLSTLVNLKTLYLNSYNSSLENSLFMLTSLEYLNLDNYQQQDICSLQTLPSLKSLSIHPKNQFVKEGVIVTTP